MNDLKYIVVDTETGGLDSRKHKLMSIGMIFLNSRLEKIGKTYLLVNDTSKKQITKEAIDTNKLDLKEIKNNGVDKEYIVKLLRNNNVRNAILVGWNTKFDIDFLKEFLGESFNEFFYYKHVDVVSMYFAKYKEFPSSLENTYKKFFGNTGITFHNALDDAEATYRLIVELLN